RPRSQIAAAAGLELADDASVLVDEMQRTSDPDVYSGGDVASALMISGARRSTMLAGPANKQGRRIADAIFADAIERGESTVKPPRVIPAKPALGTTIVGCFDVIAGFTGIQEAELLQLGIEYEAVRIDSDSNAGYYPGSQPLSIVGYVRINDGVLLGASVVGGKGADKRLDVLATAITAGMNANDLAELELAYAPQFSHSKDAVNLLGYVASKRVG
ncbi:MAG: FAD-dependent oxidoreductase, partial [Arcanobacterium sp.]|nr:FAD-dependent oxidoreductase [Arcanobacterium sp.]